MANFTTVNDLQADALFRAGEPTDGTSDYDTRVVEYLNAAQMSLLLGGPVGGEVFPVRDWWWARKNPRGVFNTAAEITTGTVTVTLGSTTVTFSSAPAASVTGYRLRVDSLGSVPRIASHTGGVATATLDVAWPEATQTAVAYHLFKIEYDLAADFLRLCGQPILVDWPYKINIVDEDTLEEGYPLTLIAAGVPSVAALIGSATIRLNHWTETAERIEYPYIYLPDDLATGGTPILPRHHRRMLSTMAAAYIALDKADTKAMSLLQEAQVYFRVMEQEHAHHMRRASQSFGRIEPRQDLLGSFGGGVLRTESGLIISG